MEEILKSQPYRQFSNEFGSRLIVRILKKKLPDNERPLPIATSEGNAAVGPVCVFEERGGGGG